MKDNFGDPIEVKVLSVGDVILTVHDGHMRSSAMASLSPKKARRLAKALRKAAKEVSE
jgi:hypothetical protein